MKIFTAAIALLVLSFSASSQTKIEKSVPVQKGQKINLDFEFPELIKIQTWDNPNILIKGSVSINNGEYDNAFELQVSQDGKGVTITSLLRDKENIPRRIVIKKGGREYFFRAADSNDPEVQKFFEENGREYTYMSHGIIQKIELEIFVPAGMETNLEAKFGMVEVKNFSAPLKVTAQFGGVDASIAARTVGELTARTRFGEILTNLDLKFDSGQEVHHHDHWTVVSVKPGSGPRYDFESKFGKVYLRKSL